MARATSNAGCCGLRQAGACTSHPAPAQPSQPPHLERFWLQSEPSCLKAPLPAGQLRGARLSCFCRRRMLQWRVAGGGPRQDGRCLQPRRQHRLQSIRAACGFKAGGGPAPGAAQAAAVGAVGGSLPSRPHQRRRLRVAVSCVDACCSDLVSEQRGQRIEREHVDAATACQLPAEQGLLAAAVAGAAGKRRLLGQQEALLLAAACVRSSPPPPMQPHATRNRHTAKRGHQQPGSSCRAANRHRPSRAAVGRGHDALKAE